MAVQIYAHRTREFDRSLAHLRKRAHLKEGQELEYSQLDAALATAQILKDKGDTGAARRPGTGVVQLLDRMKDSPPSEHPVRQYVR